MSRIAQQTLMVPASVWLLCAAASPAAAAPTILMQPISANVEHLILGQEIRISGGGPGVEITLEIQFMGWSDAPGSPLLLGGAATIDPAGYFGINASPPNSGVDLIPKGYAPPDPDGGNRAAGFYQDIFICDLTGNPCEGVVSPTCPDPGNICVRNPRFVIPPGTPFVAGAITTTLAYLCLAACEGNCLDLGIEDVEPHRYVATLILEVPESAIGTYTIGFSPDPASTVLASIESDIPGLELVPARITITPDAAAAPLAASAPHDRPKNRYISFQPNSGLAPSAFRVTKIAGPGATGPVGWVGMPDANGLARLSATMPAPRVWTEPVVHAGDCAIIPDAVYEVEVIADGTMFSPPLQVATVPRPDPKFWGDTVGTVIDGEWTPPNGVVNVNDFVIAAHLFNQFPPLPHITVADVQSVSASDPCLNRISNFADVFLLIKAFQGEPYPFTTDPADCPPCP